MSFIDRMLARIETLVLDLSEEKQRNRVLEDKLQLQNRNAEDSYGDRNRAERLASELFAVKLNVSYYIRENETQRQRIASLESELRLLKHPAYVGMCDRDVAMKIVDTNPIVGNRIVNIKEMRSARDLSLKEAKDLIDDAYIDKGLMRRDHQGYCVEAYPPSSTHTTHSV